LDPWQLRTEWENWAGAVRAGGVISFMCHVERKIKRFATTGGFPSLLLPGPVLPRKGAARDINSIFIFVERHGPFLVARFRLKNPRCRCNWPHDFVPSSDPVPSSLSLSLMRPRSLRVMLKSHVVESNHSPMIWQPRQIRWRYLAKEKKSMEIQFLEKVY
jgi:hypothetical protein